MALTVTVTVTVLHDVLVLSSSTGSVGSYRQRQASRRHPVSEVGCRQIQVQRLGSTGNSSEPASPLAVPMRRRTRPLL